MNAQLDIESAEITAANGYFSLGLLDLAEAEVQRAVACDGETSAALSDAHARARHYPAICWSARSWGDSYQSRTIIREARGLMEFPDPWHRYAPEDWARLAKAIRRLNSLRRRKGLPPLDSRPPMLALRLEENHITEPNRRSSTAVQNPSEKAWKSEPSTPPQSQKAQHQSHCGSAPQSSPACPARSNILQPRTSPPMLPGSTPACSEFSGLFRRPRFLAMSAPLQSLTLLVEGGSNAPI